MVVDCEVDFSKSHIPVLRKPSPTTQDGAPEVTRWSNHFMAAIDEELSVVSMEGNRFFFPTRMDE